MADNDTARLKKERAERAAIKKRTEEESAVCKAEQEACKNATEGLKLLVGRKNGRTSL